MKINNEVRDAAVKFGSEALVLCDWIDTTNLVFIGGRGVAKSTVILARRSERCVRLMPGAPVAIVANTYSNLIDNIMPAVQNGWKLNGLIEGVHYVKGKRPPAEWSKRCSVIVDDYRHVYSFWNGSVIFLGSLDNPSLLAGKSVAHLLFDEAKYASDSRAARVMPILRGDAITYGRCHLYGGVTITTDMPDVTEGEFDWFFRYTSEMNPERIIKTIQAAGELNKYRMKLIRENQNPTPDVRKLARIERKIDYYTEGLLKLRKGQTFFMNISSFVNIDILTLDYAKRLYNAALEHHEFLKSVLGMRPGVRQDARFYVLFGERHKYTDGTISREAAFNCSQLRFLDPSRPLEGGMDFGNMLSLVIAQPDGQYYRIHKNIYTIPPESMRELADQFLTFFESHQEKVLNLYYDRAGNNNQWQNEDQAGKIKAAIEKDGEGRRTGWSVVLMSRKQGIIRHGAEFNFMHELMSGRNKRLPLLLVDALNCTELISSIELAKAEVKYRGDVKIVAKVKKSEKLEAKKLPRLSTNFSDAFKYLMMRRSWLTAAKADSATGSGVDSMVEQWMADRFDS
ncbi:hypothetical protein [uncultured Bacteroides sp.]|uniref:hypothetical protein n=1 Tax=uncultured Bacteroides sp. TaxID=162156 RepID=UPI00267017B1|nr:hypothetical protein [uncultured Bacteroides sp.]